jgi:hypothetical protein
VKSGGQAGALRESFRQNFEDFDIGKLQALLINRTIKTKTTAPTIAIRMFGTSPPLE